MTSNCLEKCGICYEEKEFNHFKILDCNHKVCKQCFPKIKNPLCPFCRQPFSSNRRSSLPISIPNSNNNELNDVQNMFGNLIVNRQRLSYDSHLENALRLQQRQERRQNRRNRRNRRQERRNRQGIERGVTIGPSQIFDFIENTEDNTEDNKEDNAEENQKIEYRDNRRRNNRSNRWQQLNNQRNFMSHSL